jgi:hypothetical protein
MIDFDCLCHRYRFSVPSELAGDTIQCPQCKRLNDIPTPEEATRIDADGGYKVELIPDPRELDHDLAIRAFGHARIDEHGEIDMRQTFDDVLRAGVQHGPAFEGPRKVMPRYDPVTGELIVPLTIKDEQPQRVIPLEALEDEQPLEAIPITPKTLEYSRAHVRSTTAAMASAFIDLLKPANVIVMVFVLLAHLLLFTSVFDPWVVVIFTVLSIAILAHYGNVIDEIGPSERDELPVMLRNASIGEDLWRPFVNVVVALFLTYLPTLLICVMHIPWAVKVPVAMVCAAGGCLIAPVILLTMITSGAYANFRPDRIMAVLWICGPQYLIAAATFTAAMALYLLAFQTTAGGMRALFASPSFVASFGGLGVGVLLFAGAIYLMHAAAWQIGLLYRAHQPDFPWVLQRHTFTRLAQRNRPAAAIAAEPIKRMAQS